VWLLAKALRRKKKISLLKSPRWFRADFFFKISGQGAGGNTSPLFVLSPSSFGAFVQAAAATLLGFGIKKAVQLWGLHRLRLFQGDKDTRTMLATGQ
jgi:hypothetical protein